MSYSILYDKQFVKIGENQYIAMVLTGDNNVWEAGSRKRARDWYADTWLMGGKFIGTEQEIISGIDNFRQREIDKKKDEPDETYHYKDEKFGWHVGVAIYGKGTGNTTFGNFKGFYLTGIKQAMTIEELEKYGVNVELRIPYYSKEAMEKAGLEVKPDVTFTSEEQLINTIKEYEEYYKEKFSFYLTFDSEYGLSKIKRERSYANRKAKKPVQHINVHRFYVLKGLNVDGFFNKNTSRGYKWSYNYSGAKRFLTEKQAISFHNKMRNKDCFVVKTIYLGEDQTIQMKA